MPNMTVLTSDQALEMLDSIAARISSYLSSQRSSTQALLTALAKTLQATVPEHTEVTHFLAGWNVKQLDVNFKTTGFRLECSRRGTIVNVNRKMIVGGVAISLDEITMETALTEMNEQIKAAASENVDVLHALDRYLRGVGH